MGNDTFESFMGWNLTGIALAISIVDYLLLYVY